MIAIAVSDLPGIRVRSGDDRLVLTRVAMDSRAVVPGALFVAIRGGHDHVRDAVEAGAQAVLVEVGRPAEAPVVLEAVDTVVALQWMGAANRARATARVVAVTGSSGKTSTKDLLATLVSSCRLTVKAAEGHNNEIGLPFTLTQIDRETEVAVCELGMRAPGEIAFLAAMARPDVGIVTNIGVAHIGHLGSREAIAAAKGELLRALPAAGVAVVPAGEELLAPALSAAGCRVIRFGVEAAADVRVAARERGSVTLEVEGVRHRVPYPLDGAHHALNLAAAVGACQALDLPIEVVLAAAAGVRLPAWRGEEILVGGITIINDAYNANPESMDAALVALGERSVAGTEDRGPRRHGRARRRDASVPRALGRHRDGERRRRPRDRRRGGPGVPLRHRWARGGASRTRRRRRPGAGGRPRAAG